MKISGKWDSMPLRLWHLYYLFQINYLGFWFCNPCKAISRLKADVSSKLILNLYSTSSFNNTKNSVALGHTISRSLHNIKFGETEKSTTMLHLNGAHMRQREDVKTSQHWYIIALNVLCSITYLHFTCSSFDPVRYSIQG